MAPIRTIVPKATFPPNTTTTPVTPRSPTYQPTTPTPTYAAPSAPSTAAFCHPPSLPSGPRAEPYNRPRPRPRLPLSHQAHTFNHRRLHPVQGLPAAPPPPPQASPEEQTLPSVRSQLADVRDLSIPRGLGPQPPLGSMGCTDVSVFGTHGAEAARMRQAVGRLVPGFDHLWRNVERYRTNVRPSHEVGGPWEQEVADRVRQRELEDERAFAVEELRDITAPRRNVLREMRGAVIERGACAFVAMSALQGAGRGAGADGQRMDVDEGSRSREEARGPAEKIERPSARRMDVDEDSGAPVDGTGREEEIDRQPRGEMDVDEDSGTRADGANRDQEIDRRPRGEMDVDERVAADSEDQGASEDEQDSTWARDHERLMSRDEGHSETDKEKGKGREEEIGSPEDGLKGMDDEKTATSSAAHAPSHHAAWLVKQSSKSLMSSMPQEKKDKYKTDKRYWERWA